MKRNAAPISPEIAPEAPISMVSSKPWTAVKNSAPAAPAIRKNSRKRAVSSRHAIGVPKASNQAELNERCIMSPCTKICVANEVTMAGSPPGRSLANPPSLAGMNASTVVSHRLSGR
jgi:hypothetical protein